MKKGSIGLPHAVEPSMGDFRGLSDLVPCLPRNVGHAYRCCIDPTLEADVNCYIAAKFAGGVVGARRELTLHQVRKRVLDVLDVVWQLRRP